MKTMILIIICLFTTSSFAVKIKLATIVPKGTSWANTLKAFSKDVKKETNKKVKIQIYYGGVQGDEPDVLRKTRIGQLHGAIFTGKTLGDIFPDIRSIEIPFNYYHDEQKAVDAIESQKKYFDQNLAKKGFVNLGFYSIGKVYVVSTKEVKSITDLKGIKMWAWEGDKVVQAMIKSLGLVSVPLALPDVLSSLSTGMIEAAYAPPLGILALQWQSKIKYLIDFPTAYTIGALLISQKKWDKISVENQVIIKKLATKHINKANDLAVEDNKKALLQLKNLGVKFVKFPKQDIAKAEKIRKNVIKLLEGPVLSSKAIKAVELGR
jgi:TRAP-type C4-dicarboxylate transport system substrate-binding protein